MTRIFSTWASKLTPRSACLSVETRTYPMAFGRIFSKTLDHGKICKRKIGDYFRRPAWRRGGRTSQGRHHPNRQGDGAGGTGRVSSSTPRRKGPRSAAKWSLPWKQSFCSAGQDRNGTVSCPVLGTAFMLFSPITGFQFGRP